MSGATVQSWDLDPALVAGDFRALETETVKSGEGALSRGAVLARDEATDKLVALDKETAVASESIGTGSETLASVSAEVLAAGDGSTKVFHIFTANQAIVPGTVDGDATVGAAGKTFTDDGNGKISGDSGNIEGFVDYAAGYIYLSFATAPDNSTNVTADYDHGEDTKVFSFTLANVPVIPRTVTITCTVASSGVPVTDDGHGNLSGTGITGTINYETGVGSITMTTAQDDGVAITAAYSYGDAANKHLPVGILYEDVDATSADATGEVGKVGEYRAADLTWPASITAANKARAIEQLEAQGIIIK